MVALQLNHQLAELFFLFGNTLSCCIPERLFCRQAGPLHIRHILHLDVERQFVFLLLQVDIGRQTQRVNRLGLFVDPLAQVHRQQLLARADHLAQRDDLFGVLLIGQALVHQKLAVALSQRLGLRVQSGKSVAHFVRSLYQLLKATSFIGNLPQGLADQLIPCNPTLFNGVCLFSVCCDDGHQ